VFGLPTTDPQPLVRAHTCDATVGPCARIAWRLALQLIVICPREQRTCTLDIPLSGMGGRQSSKREEGAEHGGVGGGGAGAGGGAALASVDFSPFLADVGCVVGDPPTPAQLACAAQIDATCRDHGFMVSPLAHR
jgi:hypothetical protein